MEEVENINEDASKTDGNQSLQPESVERESVSTPAEAIISSKNSESVIDYAKNTMNSFLSMYGYEESMTTEALKSKIKSEPPSPNKEMVHSYSEDVTSTLIKGIKSDDKKDGKISSPRTATVMPIQSTSSSEERIESIHSSVHGLQGNKSISAPRKPITPYMRYRNMIFEEIKHKFPGCSPYDLACLISSKWSMLTDSERKVWEVQYEQEMREYTVNMKEYSETLKKIYKSSDQLSPPTIVKGSVSEDGKPPVRQGNCNWCKKATVLLDFSVIHDGREIYCTGLCSEKCFTEAAKQIVSIENGSNKPRYVSGSRMSRSQSRDENRVTSTFTTFSHYSTVSSTDTTQAAFQVFDWDHYLIETQSSAAPWLYFKQSRYPPSNNFVVGMKLEASNGQTIPGYSLATVVTVCGSRILLHFDGSDASSDIWRLPDSGDIHPVGWTEASQLKAPSGYKYDYGKYRRFHASSLQNAEIAPARLFKKEPTTPIENYFVAGMKLEAVYKQNPAIVGVATVIDIDEERIRIDFDGYKGSGYWCHFSDRDLFPAGWCSRSGHPLKSPGSTDKVYLVHPQRSSSPSVSSSSSESRSVTSSPYIVYPAVLTTRDATATWKDKNMSGNNVEIFINSDCYCGPYLDARKLEQMQHVYRGSIVTVLKSVLEDTIRCAIDSKTVFGFLKPGRGNCVITATCDGMTYQCCLNSVDRVSTFWRVLEQFSDNLRCCVNLFSSVDYRLFCNRCNNNRSKSTVSSAEPQSKMSTIPSTFSTGIPRRTDSKLHEIHKQVMRQDFAYNSANYNVALYEAIRDAPESVEAERQVPVRQDSLRCDNLREDSFRQENLRKDSLRQESLRQESLRQETLMQDSLRQDNLRHDSLIQENLIQDSLRQDNLRPESIRQEHLRTDSLYENHGKEGYSNGISKEDIPSIKKNYDIDIESAGDGKQPSTKRKRVDKNEAGGVEVLSAPKLWSIDQVISFIRQTDLRDYVDQFKDNEIDGKALLLLQRDLVLCHMGFKLGPAVKLLDLIEELKAVQEKFR